MIESAKERDNLNIRLANESLYTQEMQRNLSY